METLFQFTKAHIDALPVAEKRKRFRDRKVDGLVLEVSPKGAKTFRVYKRIKGRTSPISVTLGRYPGMSIENARGQALALLDELNSGINPNEKVRAQKKALVLLQRVYDDYIKAKKLRASTVRGYAIYMRTHLASLVDKPLQHISEAMIKELHANASKASPAQADGSMRLLRALFNFAKFEYRGVNDEILFPHNPVGILNHLKQWNNLPSRQTRLSQAQLPDWFNALDSIRHEAEPFACACCDLVEMAVLTGLRKGELLKLTWDRVDLRADTFYLDTTKNGYPLELPIAAHLKTLLVRRHERRTNDEFVFSVENNYGVIREPKKIIRRIAGLANAPFTMHDLRRTFTTTAESLNVGKYTIKRLLNHRTQRGDVTGGYIVLTPEELRLPAQAVENRLLQLAGRKQNVGRVDQALAARLLQLSAFEKQELLKQLQSAPLILAEAV